MHFVIGLVLRGAAAEPARPFGSRVQTALELCVDRGLAQRVARELYLTRELHDEARAAIVENCAAHAALDIPSLRDRLATTRKFLIPLLEHFDTQGLTLRQGGHRVLKRR